MSAETLRHAAEKLREQANAVENTEWRTNRFFWKVESPTLDDGWWWAVTDADGDVALLSERDDDQWDTAEQRATYIATMHPGVGLALAAWLESEVSAAEWREGQSEHMNADRVRPEPFPVYYDRTTEKAIVVARMILGGEA